MKHQHKEVVCNKVAFAQLGKEHSPNNAGQDITSYHYGKKLLCMGMQ